MRNKISAILILVFAVLLVVSMFHGISIGKFEILSIEQLENKNDQLNTKIDMASRVTTIDYPESIENLEDTYGRYLVQKQKYEDLVDLGNGSKGEIYETKQYDIGYIWKVFGKYATSRNLTIGLDVQKSSSIGGNLYNLNFNVSGQYVNISQFITDIENNSNLNFRIYDFKMSGSGETISSTFTVKDVNIDPSTITNATNSYVAENQE